MQASIALITSVDVTAQRVIATLKPTEQESGWLTCLTAVHEGLAGQEALVVPCSGSLADALVIPYPLPSALIATVVGPSEVVIGVSQITLAITRTTLPLEEHIGRDVIIVPTPTDLVATGVLL